MSTGPLQLDNPQMVMDRLAQIEYDLALRQNGYEAAARDWYAAKRDIERARAEALLSAEDKSVTEKKARAELAALSQPGVEHEAEYEAYKAVLRVLEARSIICTSLLKAQGRI